MDRHVRGGRSILPITDWRVCIKGFLLTFLVTVGLSMPVRGETEEKESSREDERMIRALMRLEELDLDSAPDLKKRVLDYLRRNQGSEQFLDIIERFEIRELNGEVLDMALRRPQESRGVRAAQWLLELGEVGRFQKVLRNEDPETARNALTVLGLSGVPTGMGVIQSVITDPDRPRSLRSHAVEALGRSRTGERALLELVQKGTLPSDMEFQAANVLQASQDEAIREAAAKEVALPASADDEPLPPIGELAQRQGDPENGKAVFERACAACHQVNSQGINFGPDLSEIGDKLAREEMYVAILDPSAAISHGYEGYEVEMESGATYVGFITSETDSTLTLRLQGGIDQRLPKSEIVSRKAMDRSLMIPNLQQAMTEQELVDLVELLDTLEKTGSPEARND